MWCPECDKVRVCRAIPAAEVTGDPKDYEQRFYFTRYQDVQFFQRGRECRSCGRKFLTTECNKQFLVELTELRRALSGIRSNAESYILESKKASESLKQLHKSLSVLRALNIYKDGDV